MKKLTSKNIHFALRQLLLEGQVGTQEAICKALEKQGFSVNQSKVSRLLNKVGAIKVSDPQGNNLYRLPHEHGLAHELQHPPARAAAQNWVLDIVSNGVLIVVHTTPGAAGLVARDLDLHHLDLKILGSIAGDDTIFIAPKDIKKIKQVIEKIKDVLS
jgi:transcriptional regulator of arginine metabolism